jgi:hypothetical protein
MARSLAFWFEKPISTNVTTTTEAITARDAVTAKDGTIIEHAIPAKDAASNNINKHPEVELHFNYWSLKSNDINYLDIGVEIAKSGNFDSLNFFLPFDKEFIEYSHNLGGIVCKNADLVVALFNNPQAKAVPDDKNHGTYNVTLTSDKSIKFYTQIEEQKNIPLGGVKIDTHDTDEKKGTMLSFPAELFGGRDRQYIGYFRFRIVLKGNQHNAISVTRKSKDAMITAHLDSTELIDFRVNEPRNLPAQIRTRLNSVLPISGINFFLIRDANTEYKMSHTEFQRCRLLERDLWAPYLVTLNNSESPETPEQMLIYHWKDIKEEKMIEHFSAYAKFSMRTVSLRKILGLISTIVFLGGVGSYISSYIPKIDWDKSHKDLQSRKISLNCKSDGLDFSTPFTCQVSNNDEMVGSGGEATTGNNGVAMVDIENADPKGDK